MALLVASDPIQQDRLGISVALFEDVIAAGASQNDVENAEGTKLLKDAGANTCLCSHRDVRMTQMLYDRFGVCV